MSKTIIGIDPGKSGAVAILTPEQIVFHDCPNLMLGGKQAPDPLGMVDLLRGYPNAFIALERVGAMPGQGVVSTFSFGTNYGIWLGAVAALKLPYELISPNVWKKAIGVPVGEKQGAIAIALRLFPQCAQDLRRKKDHGRADALLLAEYLRRRNLVKS